MYKMLVSKNLGYNILYIKLKSKMIIMYLSDLSNINLINN